MRTALPCILKPAGRGAYLFLIYGFLYIPLLVAMVFSFNDSRYALEWKGFSLRWYERLLENDSLIDALWNSLFLAASSSTIATLLATMAAVAVYRYSFAGKNMVYTSLIVMAMSPEVVMGISFAMMFIILGVSFGYQTLLLAHVALSFPFITMIVLARLNGFDKNVLEAAMDLGAEEVNVLRHILIPMIFPAIMAGWLMGFTLSMDDVVIAFFVAGPSFDVLPLKIYAMVRTGVKPDVNALCTIMFSATLILVVGSHFLLKEKK